MSKNVTKIRFTPKNPRTIKDDNNQKSIKYKKDNRRFLPELATNESKKLMRTTRGLDLYFILYKVATEISPMRDPVRGTKKAPYGFPHCTSLK